MQTATPFLIIALTVLIAVVGYLVKESIAQGKLSVGFERDIKSLVDGHRELKGALRYYLDSVGKAQAVLLTSDNPSPPDMQVLLRKHVNGTINSDERTRLAAWLRTVYVDTSLSRGERSAASTLLASINTIEWVDKIAINLYGNCDTADIGAAGPYGRVRGDHVPDPHVGKDS